MLKLKIFVSDYACELGLDSEIGVTQRAHILTYIFENQHKKNLKRLK